MRFGRQLGSLFAVAALAAACTSGTGIGGTGASGSAGKLQVVTTTTVLADIVANVGGDLVSATSLVPKNADVHTFEPRPSDVRTVASAKLLVMNGLGLDDWLTKMIGNAAAEGTPLLRLGVDLPGVQLLPGETAATENPHLWMDVKYAELYVDRIAAALKAADPTHASGYDASAATYKQRLETLDTWVRAQIQTIPAANRKLVTFHDAFPYYAREYGIEIVGVAVGSPGQDPSAGYTAQLISTIEAAGVKAIFSEAQFPAKLVDQLASEAHCTVVANLYDDALGDPPVTSYEELIRWDTDQLVMALR
ncbi:MAG TPA: metal ABC transporter substrate-binding protein [Candidatus Limnocylindrales bacterium]